MTSKLRPLVKTSALKRTIAYLLSIALMLSLFVEFSSFSETSAAVTPPDTIPTPDTAWIGTDIKFNNLLKVYPGTNHPTNFVTFKDFDKENHPVGQPFSLLPKYAANAYTIIIEDAYDLSNWSSRCFSNPGTGATPNMLEESDVYLKANYVLGNNIDYGAQIVPGMIPIGVSGSGNTATPGPKFTGTFDGQGFEISNLKISSLGSDYLYNSVQLMQVGMFGTIGVGGTVTNLGLFNPQYTSDINFMNFPFHSGGIAGKNEGTVSFCFVNSTSTVHTYQRDATQVAGVVHTNMGTISNVYYAGPIKIPPNPALASDPRHNNLISNTYSPISHINSGSITDAFYDTTLYDGGAVTPITGVTGATTANLIIRNGCLTADEWYPDNYASAIGMNTTTFPQGHPRLQGFKVNSGTNNDANPFLIRKPADFIFLSRMGNHANATAATNFFAAARRYRIINCLNMNSVSEYAWVSPTTTFRARIDGGFGAGKTYNASGIVNTDAAGDIIYGSAACTCGGTGMTHPGTGLQTHAHSIINLKLRTLALLGDTAMSLGLFTSSTNTDSQISDLNFVGGSLIVPPITEASAAARILYVGMVGGRIAGIKLVNVHTSADISIDDSTSNNWMKTARVGGLIGDMSGSSSSTFINCSNSGAITMGKHKTAWVADIAYSAVGGVLGASSSNGAAGTRIIFRNVKNYGNITGFTFIKTVPNSVSALYFNKCGGIIGHSSLSIQIRSLVNYGNILPVADMTASPDGLPCVGYSAGSISGTQGYPSHAFSDADNRSEKIYSPDSVVITAHPVDKNQRMIVTVGGLFGDMGSSATNEISKCVSDTKIYVSDKMANINVAGIANQTCVITTTDGAPPSMRSSISRTAISGLSGGQLKLSPIYMTNVSGFIGGDSDASQSASTTYIPVTDCINKTNINLKLADTVSGQTVSVFGLCTQNQPVNSRNDGNITINAERLAGPLIVAGVAIAGYSAVDSSNAGAINISIKDSVSNTAADSLLAISGFSHRLITHERCINYSDITVTSENHYYTTASASSNVGLVVSGIGYATSSSVYSGCINHGDISVDRKIGANPGSGITHNYNTFISGIRGGIASTVTFSDCVNKGSIDFDNYYEGTASPAPATLPLVASYNIVTGVAGNAVRIERCRNEKPITIAKTKPFFSTGNLYIAGIVYSSAASSLSNLIDSCVNIGKISAPNNIGNPLSTVARTIYIAGITNLGSVASTRCVNEGTIEFLNVDTTRTDSSTPAVNTFYIAGVTNYTANIDNSRNSTAPFGIKNLANTGNITFKHLAADFPLNAKIFVSGIAGYFGTGHYDYRDQGGDIIEVNNLVNYGNINVELNTENAVYGTTAANSWGATSANCVIGGVSAMAGYNPNGANNPKELPFKNCANLGSITLDITKGSSPHSTQFNYAVGGVVGTSATNSNNIAYHKLDILDAVNGGSVTVVAPDPVRTSGNLNNQTGMSGVGGILGFAYQQTSNITVAQQESFGGKISRCINFGAITGGISTGGIVGTDCTTIDNVLNFGTVTSGNNGSAGGIIGSILSQGKSTRERTFANVSYAVNYGQVLSGGGTSSIGGIIGKIDVPHQTTATTANPPVLYDPNLGIRKFTNVLNATAATADHTTTGGAASLSTIPWVGSILAPTAAQTDVSSYSYIYEITTPAIKTTRDVSYGASASAVIPKLVTDNGDSDSIYDDSFEWKVNPPTYFSYLLPEQSARNAAVPSTSPVIYAPYEFGIYALSTGTAYLSANILLGRIHPQSPGGASYTSWMFKGGSTNVVQVALSACRQLIRNDEAEIVRLELKATTLDGDGNPVTIYLRSAETDPDPLVRKVTFYVHKDNFEPASYLILNYDLSEYSEHSIGSFFSDSLGIAPLDTYIDLTGITSADFDGTAGAPIPVYLTSESEVVTNTWMIEFVFKEDLYDAENYDPSGDIGNYPVVELTAARQGAGSVNANGVPYSFTNTNAYGALTNPLNTDPLTNGECGYDLGEIPYGQTYLTLFLNTVDLHSGSNKSSDVTLEKMVDGVGVPVTADTADNTSGTTVQGARRVGYYKVPAPSGMGDNSLNFKPADRIDEPLTYVPYKDYTGKMTINIRVDDILTSGTYRIVFETVYGPVYFYFNRALSKETYIYNNTQTSTVPEVILVSSGTTYVRVAIDNVNKKLSNNTNTTYYKIPYGDAPDLRMLGMANDFFRNPLNVSVGATASKLTFIKTVENANRSLTYQFTFTVTAEDPTVSSLWTLDLITQPLHDEPAVVTANFRVDAGSGKPIAHTSEDIKNSDYQNEELFINEVETNPANLTFSVFYVLTNSSTGGANGIFNAAASNTGLNYFDWDVYRNGMLIPKTDYITEGISVVKAYQAADSSAGTPARIALTVTLQNSLLFGRYDVVGKYVRTGQPIDINFSPTLTDQSGKMYFDFNWDDVEYTPFTFFKAIGSKLCYAKGLISQPYNATQIDMFLVDPQTGLTPPLPISVPWVNNLFDYSGMLIDVNDEEAMNFIHREFRLVAHFTRDLHFSNYVPIFNLPDGAKLYREEPDGSWVLVSEEEQNMSVNMRNGREVRYRVYAQDDRYYNDYVITLNAIERKKLFEIDYQYIGCSPSDVPAISVFRYVEPGSAGYEQLANFTIFSHPSKLFGVEAMPSGLYVLDVDIPYGYQASISCDNPVLSNTLPISGQSLLDVLNAEDEQYRLTIIIEPIIGFERPWGIRRDSKN